LAILEAPARSGLASLLNLQAVDVAQRAALWTRSVKSFFPGLSVRELGGTPDRGSISGMPFGPGRLWTVVSPSLLVSYDPSALCDDHNDVFSVMMQLHGSTTACQKQRRCTLRPGEFCLIDSRLSFELEVAATSSQFMFVQMPRHAVLARHPYLERRTAELFDPADAGARLLRGLLLSVLEQATLLEDDQRASTLSAIIQLLGAPRLPAGRKADEVSWRVRAALACIDAALSDTAVSAEQIAKMQGISRRRLDEIMIETVGASLTAQIWIRRLSQAATDLADPRCAGRSVSQIAFAAGFEDPAHFTRAFKRRFGCTPREWRLRAGAASAPLPPLDS